MVLRRLASRHGPGCHRLGRTVRHLPTVRHCQDIPTAQVTAVDSFERRATHFGLRGSKYQLKVWVVNELLRLSMLGSIYSV